MWEPRSLTHKPWAVSMSSIQVSTTRFWPRTACCGTTESMLAGRDIASYFPVLRTVCCGRNAYRLRVHCLVEQNESSVLALREDRHQKRRHLACSDKIPQLSRKPGLRLRGREGSSGG